MSSAPTIYAYLRWGEEGCEDALLLWYNDGKPHVEARGKYWQGSDPTLYLPDSLHRTLDAMPGWFVSGLFCDEVVPVTPWERYVPPYRVLEALLDEDNV